MNFKLIQKEYNLTFYYLYIYICDRINIRSIEFEFSSNFVRMNGINTLVLSLILLNSIQRKKRNTFTRLGNICSRSSWKLCRSDLPCARECARSAKSILIQRAYLRWREFQDDRLEKKIILELSLSCFEIQSHYCVQVAPKNLASNSQPCIISFHKSIVRFHEILKQVSCCSRAVYLFNSDSMLMNKNSEISWKIFVKETMLKWILSVFFTLLCPTNAIPSLVERSSMRKRNSWLSSRWHVLEKYYLRMVGWETTRRRNRLLKTNDERASVGGNGRLGTRKYEDFCIWKGELESVTRSRTIETRIYV